MYRRAAAVTHSMAKANLSKFFSVLVHNFSVLEHPFLLCPVLFRVPSRILTVPARPVPNFGCPGPYRPLVRFLACPVVPLSRDKEETSVPLSRKVASSRPVGNPSRKCPASCQLGLIPCHLLSQNNFDCQKVF